MKNITSFKLNTFTVFPSENTIENQLGEKVTLQPKFIQVLAYLVDHYPRLVSREELIDSIWNGNYYVGEKSLTNAIWNLRQELNKCDKDCIKTVRKSGYLLLIEPEVLLEKSSEKKGLSSISKPAHLWRQLSDKRLFHFLSSIVFVLATYILLKMSGYKDINASSQITEPKINIRKITTSPGRELYPAISPDHNFMIYSWRKIDEHTHLYLKNLAQPDLAPKQLTFGENRESKPIWSLDGKTIYFVRKSQDRSLCQIIKLDIDMVREDVLADCPGSVNISIALSKDNRTLAFTGISEGYLKSGIYFIDLTSANKIPFRFSCGDDCTYQDRDFAFSPNGKFIAVTRRLELSNEDIYLIDLANNNTRQLTQGEGDILGLTWHPDGSRLVYASENSGIRQGFEIALDTNNVTNLDISGFSFPKFVPGSHKLVYHDWHLPTYISYLTLSQDVKSTPFPLIQSDFSHHSPHYSAINKQLIYISNESGYNEIWRSNTDGTERTKITNLEINLMAPRWSHNGKFVAFLGPQKHEKGNSLYILDVNQLSVIKIKTPFQSHYRPSWSLDDTALIAAAENNNKISLFKIYIKQEKVVNLGGDDSSFAIQTAKDKIWFTKGRYQGLWLLNPSQLETKPVQVLDENEFVVRYNWEVSKQGLYYQQDTASYYSINFYDFSTKNITTLVKLPARTLKRYGSMTYIAEAEKILFTQSDYPQVDIKQLEHSWLK